jgi:hypothetical protein
MTTPFEEEIHVEVMLDAPYSQWRTEFRGNKQALIVSFPECEARPPSCVGAENTCWDIKSAWSRDAGSGNARFTSPLLFPAVINGLSSTNPFTERLSLIVIETEVATP